MDYLMLIGGLVILIFSGDLLVKGAVNLALQLKIPPLIIGLTVVSIGTSAPELFASLKAVGMGAADISVGNVVGSNIANLALVLGLTTIIFPVVVRRTLLWNEWIVLTLVSTLFVVFSLDGKLSTWDGIAFLVLLVSYLVFLVFSARSKKKKKVELEVDEEIQIGRAHV